MKRIIIIFLITLIILTLFLILFIHLNRDKIAHGITNAIKEATGQPLHTETIPELSFFPMPGIVLGKSTWGNPKTDKLSLSVTQCSFKISLFQLLSGNIAINEIFLEEPIITINYKNNSTPSKNSEAMFTETVSNKDISFPSITIASLTIKNGTILFYNNYRQLTIKELNVSAHDIKQEHLGKIDLSAFVSVQPENIAFSIQCNTSILPEINSIILKSFTTHIMPNKGLPFTTPIKISGKVRYLFNKKLLENMDLKADLKNFTATTKGSINLDDVSGDISIVANGSLKQLAQDVGVVFVTPERKALEKFSITAMCTLRNRAIQTKNLNILLDDSKITGNLAIDLPKKIEGTLAITTINLDHYVPMSIAQHNPIEKIIQSAPTKLPTKPTTIPKSSQQNFPDLNLTLIADTITMAKLRLQSFNSKLAGTNNTYHLNPCSFIFYESQVSVNGTAQNLNTQPSYNINITTTNINIASLIHDLNLSKAAVVRQGSIQISAAMDSYGKNIEQVKHTLNGNAKINGKNIVIHFEAIPKAVAELTNLGKQTFTELNSNIQAKNGTLTLHKFILVGKPASASAKGFIILPNNSIKIHADIALNNTIIPVHIYGNLMHPSYGVDSIKIIQDAVKTMLNTGEKNIINTILPKNTKKNIHNATEKLFHKIFGK